MLHDIQTLESGNGLAAKYTGTYGEKHFAILFTNQAKGDSRAEMISAAHAQISAARQPKTMGARFMARLSGFLKRDFNQVADITLSKSQDVSKAVLNAFEGQDDAVLFARKVKPISGLVRQSG